MSHHSSVIEHNLHFIKGSRLNLNVRLNFNYCNFAFGSRKFLFLIITQSSNLLQPFNDSLNNLYCLSSHVLKLKFPSRTNFAKTFVRTLRRFYCYLFASSLILIVFIDRSRKVKFVELLKRRRFFISQSFFLRYIADKLEMIQCQKKTESAIERDSKRLRKPRKSFPSLLVFLFVGSVAKTRAKASRSFRNHKFDFKTASAIKTIYFVARRLRRDVWS